MRPWPEGGGVGERGVGGEGKAVVVGKRESQGHEPAAPAADHSGADGFSS